MKLNKRSLCMYLLINQIILFFISFSFFILNMFPGWVTVIGMDLGISVFAVLFSLQNDNQTTINR